MLIAIERQCVLAAEFAVSEAGARSPLRLWRRHRRTSVHAHRSARTTSVHSHRTARRCASLTFGGRVLGCGGGGG